MTYTDKDFRAAENIYRNAKVAVLSIDEVQKKLTRGLRKLFTRIFRFFERAKLPGRRLARPQKSGNENRHSHEHFNGQIKSARSKPYAQRHGNGNKRVNSALQSRRGRKDKRRRNILRQKAPKPRRRIRSKIKKTFIKIFSVDMRNYIYAHIDFLTFQLSTFNFQFSIFNFQLKSYLTLFYLFS